MFRSRGYLISRSLSIAYYSKLLQNDVDQELKLHRSLETPDSWVKRDSRLIPLTGPLPFNAEPMTQDLMKNLITPSEIHFVRNHGHVPKLDWMNHKVKITGLINNNELELSMDELLKVADPVEMTVTIACDGNRRKELNLIKHTKGFNWGPGACGTSVWKGIKLFDLLNYCGGLKEDAQFIHFTGSEDLPMGKYSTSIPIVLLPQETLLAYEMNGERLPPDHGFPLRVVIPGFVGGRMVKWLSNIEVSNKESESYYHLYDNKVLPYPTVDLDTSLTSPWWVKPENVLYQHNINSVITSPSHQEWLEIKEGSYDIKGYAYSGGGRVINRVEVSLNGGVIWNLMKLEFAHKPSSGGYKSFTWCHWKGTVSIFQLLRAEKIIVRAWDQTCNTQPQWPSWNVLGMMNNCWYQVRIYPGDSTQWVTFKHPVLPGAHVGGWMMSEHISTTMKLPLVSAPSESQQEFTLKEVKKHNKEEDLWIVIDRCVIDMTSYVKEHPGGLLPILLKAGQDATLLFHEIHSREAFEIKDHFSIGILKDEIPITQVKYALDSRRWLDSKLIEKKSITHDTKLFTFKLSDTKKVGLPLGQHILLSADIKHDGPTPRDDIVVRPYTPISPINLEEDCGCVDLVVKIYNQCGGRPGGVMSMHLDSISIGDSVRIKGAAGPIHYHGNGVMTISGRSIKASNISMIAGGTGITPMYQIMRSIASNDEDDTKVSLLYANHSPEDILLFKELNKLEEESDKISIWYTVDEIGDKTKNWKYSTGFISERMMREHLIEPSDVTIALVCGPPAMVQRTCIPKLEEFGYLEDNIFEF